jgi:hypothetical protein
MRTQCRDQDVTSLCPCGSGRKTKHRCGEHRGPSDEQLARAHVAQLFHQTIHELNGLSDGALDRLWDGLIDLPALDLSLLVTLPTLIGRDLRRLREAIEHDDADRGWDARTAVHNQIDTRDNAHDSPTRSSASATNTRSAADKPPTRAWISTPKAPA